MADQQDVIELDFTGAAPVSSARAADHVPPGQYRLKLTKLEQTKTRTGKAMLVGSFSVAAGDQLGRRLSENFVMPRAGTDDSLFGLQRFHGLLVALGAKEQNGKVRLKLSSLVGKECVADVDDEVVPATDAYPERLRSRPLSFEPVSSSNSSKAAKAAPAAQVEPEPEAEPDAEPEPEPAPVEAAVAADEVTTSLDDLFDGIE